ncbi:unnamed protein product, partial [Rotaria magnacalcarata]
MQGIYQQFFGAWRLAAFNLLPPIFMLLFGLYTVRNIRQSISRVTTNNSQNRVLRHPLRKTTDRQMVQMMLAQSTVFIFTGSLPSVNFLYTPIRSNQTVGAVQATRDNFPGRETRRQVLKRI